MKRIMESVIAKRSHPTPTPSLPLYTDTHNNFPPVCFVFHGFYGQVCGMAVDLWWLRARNFLFLHTPHSASEEKLSIVLTRNICVDKVYTHSHCKRRGFYFTPRQSFLLLHPSHVIKKFAPLRH